VGIEITFSHFISLRLVPKIISANFHKNWTHFEGMNSEKQNTVLFKMATIVIDGVLMHDVECDQSVVISLFFLDQRVSKVITVSNVNSLTGGGAMELTLTLVTLLFITITTSVPIFIIFLRFIRLP